MTACMLLLVLLSFFAVSNYQREKDLVLQGVAQRGLTLLRFVNSSLRSSIQEEIRATGGNEFSWENHIEAAAVQALEHPGVDYLIIVDSAAKILSAAGDVRDNDILSIEQFLSDARGVSSRSMEWKSRVVTLDNGDQKIQILSPYLPPNMMGRHMSNKSWMRGMGGGRSFWRDHRSQLALVQQTFEKLKNAQPYYVIQLDFDQFSSPLNRQILQIFILGLVILFVGVGGMLSFVTLKGLRGSQKRLSKMEAFSDILVSSLPIGLIATDDRGKIQICNDSAQEYLGISFQGVIGSSAEASLMPEVACMLAGKVSTERLQNSNEVNFTSNSIGSKDLSLASHMVLDSENDFAGEVLLIRDLTQIKSLEKELRTKERLAALGKMAAGVAHELRNPLSSIKGLALLLKSKIQETDTENETADLLVKEVERLNRSIGELLDYAKPANVERVDVYIGDIIQKTISLIELDAKAYGVHIVLNVAQGVGTLPIDEDKIKQLLLNLFLNSLQAMPTGGILSVDVDQHKGFITIDIEDSGEGISTEDLNKVFNPYFTTKNDGTGLGLSMSRKIVEEHDGKMEISSKEGQSTHVSVWLPIVV